MSTWMSLTTAIRRPAPSSAIKVSTASSAKTFQAGSHSTS